MSLAASTDIADRLGRDLATGETAPVNLLLESAEAVIAAAADIEVDALATLTTDQIKKLKWVCIELVCRSLPNPQGIRGMQETLGQHSTNVQFRDLYEGGGLVLTATEELIVRRAVHGTTTGSSRAVSIVNVYEVAGS